jgi:DNA invertase Pin-like site-specific DNA recombinase
MSDCRKGHGNLRRSRRHPQARRRSPHECRPRSDRHEGQAGNIEIRNATEQALNADIFSDKISGTRTSRPGLVDLLSRVRPGDSITVHSLDRLGRSALHVFQTIADLEERGVVVHSLKESEAALTGATGEFVRKLMVLVAELERNMNAERVAEARAARAARAQLGEQVAGHPRTALFPSKVA